MAELQALLRPAPSEWMEARAAGPKDFQVLGYPPVAGFDLQPQKRLGGFLIRVQHEAFDHLIPLWGR